MSEDVELVDDAGRTTGVADRSDAHRDGSLHRAVSVFIIRDDRLLLQRRADAKYLFGGLWTNTCCTHPRPGESPLAAARRRLPEEMGMTVRGLEEVGSFVYVAPDPVSGLTEHEFDHVLVGTAQGVPSPDPAEVADWSWVELGSLRHRLEAEPDQFTPWLSPALQLVMKRSQDHPQARGDPPA